MMYLSEIAQAVNGELLGADVFVGSVDTDSRKVMPGQLFVAIKGERFDGHAFVNEAFAKGAVAALVDSTGEWKGSVVSVKDTRVALGRLAAYWRGKLLAKVVALTGSNGKTTTKEMLVSILNAATGYKDAVHATQGNLNNDIGMPLTLLRARESHHYIVLEMGMNHLGEIAYLTDIGRPDIAVVINAGTAHIGELGSRENIAQAKGEIYQGLGEHGVAIINQDDRFADYWRNLNSGRQIMTFGTSKNADIQGQWENGQLGGRVLLTFSNQQFALNMQVLGQHQLNNALAAAASAWALGINAEAIIEGLSSFKGVSGRLQRKMTTQQAVLIDDTYNANPDSMKAAIDVLITQLGKKILVMGDMGELGEEAPSMHAEIGRYALNRGVETLYALGENSVHAVESFGKGAVHFKDIQTLIEELNAKLKPEVCVLVKGSRFMRMERVVEALTGLDVLHQNISREKQSCC